MDLVVDANIFLAVALNEPEKNQIIQLTAGARLIAPEVLLYEIGNALSAMMKRQRLTYQQTTRAFSIIGLIPVVLEKADIMQALKISHSFNTYAYDAYYLEVAHRLQIPLMTLDQKMKNIGNSLNINLLEI
jgi:predicted nucleic acid-binding protein